MTDKLNRFTSGKLVDEMAERNSTASKPESNLAMNRTFDAIAAILARGEDVRIAGFGTFRMAHQAQRQGRNPKTMEPITIAARDVMKFKPGKPA